MIIGLVGFAGSGKDTVANHLVKEWGFHADSFAKPLKDAACAIFGWDREMIEGQTPESRKWRENPDKFWSRTLQREFTPRMSIQLLGTEAGQKVFGRNVWVGSLLKRIENYDKVVVTDVRFRHEVEAITQARGTLIRVQRGENPIWFSHLNSLYQNEDARDRFMSEFCIHKSEWDWVGSYIDYTVTNNGTLEDLYDKISYIMTEELI